MHVLHIMANGQRGGGADHLLGLLPALAQQGLQVQAAVGEQGPLLTALRQHGIAASPLAMQHSRVAPQVVWRLQQLLAAQQPDIVHFHGTRAAFYGASWRQLQAAYRQVPAGRQRLPRSVYTAHGLAYRQAPQRGLRRALLLASEALACRADGVISVCQADLADLQRHYCIRTRQPRAYIGNAVDTQRFTPAAAAAARQRYQLAPAAFIVGSTARLVRQKGLADWLTALHGLARQLPTQALQGVIVGEGPQRAWLQQHPAIRQAPGNLQIIFLGDSAEVASILPAFDVFALASLWEGEPIALLEAQACGIPCVATRTPGAAALLAGEAGLLCNIGQPEQLAAALLRLHADAKLRQQCVQRGLARARRRTYTRQAAQVMAFYRQLLETTQAAAC